MAHARQRALERGPDARQKHWILLKADQVERRNPEASVLTGILHLMEFEVGAFLSAALFLDNLYDPKVVVGRRLRAENNS
jgi:hypothetical protein